MHTLEQKKKPPQQTKSADGRRSGRAFSGQNREVRSILHLQRTIGNHAVLRLLQFRTEDLDEGLLTGASRRFAYDFSRIPVYRSRGAKIQPKPTISTPGDVHEEEADRVADQVMRMAEPQLQCDRTSDGGCPTYGREQRGQQEQQTKYRASEISTHSPALPQAPNIEITQPVDQFEEEARQMADLVLKMPESAYSSSPNKAGRITSLRPRAVTHRGGGQPLSAKDRTFFEPRFGADFSQVRIHDDSRAHQTTRVLDARAFTVGHDISFRAGEYQPDSSLTQRLLAHELTHVVQQSQGSRISTSSLSQRITKSPGQYLARAPINPTLPRPRLHLPRLPPGGRSAPPCLLPCYPAFHSVLCSDGTPITTRWERLVFHAMSELVVELQLMHWPAAYELLEPIHRHIQIIRNCIRNSNSLLTIDQSRLLRRIRELIVPSLVDVREAIVFRWLYGHHTYSVSEIEARARRAASYIEDFFCI